MQGKMGKHGGECQRKEKYSFGGDQERIGTVPFCPLYFVKKDPVRELIEKLFYPEIPPTYQGVGA